jgi:hypothetical protein
MTDVEHRPTEVDDPAAYEEAGEPAPSPESSHAGGALLDEVSARVARYESAVADEPESAD